jgi:hypothetical protein
MDQEGFRGGAATMLQMTQVSEMLHTRGGLACIPEHFLIDDGIAMERRQIRDAVFVETRLSVKVGIERRLICVPNSIANELAGEAQTFGVCVKGWK